MDLTGNKYDKNLSIKEIAKLIRADIKAIGYTKANSYNISVTSDHNAININVISIPSNIEIYSNKNIDLNTYSKTSPDYFRQFNEKYSQKWRTIRSNLQNIHHSYNYDDSDAMSDYYSVNYYGTVSMPI